MAIASVKGASLAGRSSVVNGLGGCSITTMEEHANQKQERHDAVAYRW